MAYTVTDPSDTRALTTLFALEEVLGTDVTSYPAAMERLMMAASGAVESYTGRVYARQTYQERVEGSATELLLLTHSPIIGTPTVLCDGEAVVDFEVQDADAGSLYREVGWQVGAWVGWDVEATVTPTAELLYTVTYTAGYLLPGQEGRNLPYEVEQACIETVAAWWRRDRRGGGDVTSKRVGDLAITYGAATGDPFGLPMAARVLLPRRLV